MSDDEGFGLSAAANELHRVLDASERRRRIRSDPNPVPYLGWRWLFRRTKRGRK